MKKKPKAKKFRSADEAKRARELKQGWAVLLDKYGLPNTTKRKHKLKSKGVLKTLVSVTNLNLQKELDRGVHVHKARPDPIADVSVKSKEGKQTYTGTAVLGISTLHKSNAVPVFSKEDAIEISKMRRN